MPEKQNPIPRGHIEKNRYISPGLTTDSRPKQASLPDMVELRDLPNDQLLSVLEHYGVIEPWHQMKQRATEYVQRMSRIRPGDEQAIQDAVDEITTTASRRGMLGLNRRIYETWSSLDAIDGNLNQDMIWICEDDESSCTGCKSHGGEIKSYAEWQIEGPPGAAICKGGDYCRCQLVAVD